MSEVKNANEAIVVHISKDSIEVTINRGRENGIKEGEIFLVYGLGPEITDFETNESLGRLEIVRGKGVVVHVQEKMATIQSNLKIPRATKKTTSFNPLFKALSQESVVEESMPDEYKPFKGVKIKDLAKRI